MSVQPAVAAHLDELRLVDHHVHSVLDGALDRAGFESHLTESSEPIPPWMTQFDSQVGFAVRRHCAPVLGLEAGASADAYWSARLALGQEDATSALLRASGIGTSLIDTGVVGGVLADRDGEVATPGALLGLSDFAALSGQRVHEIARLETMLEQLAADGVEPDELEVAVDAAIASAARTAVGFKSIIAYRTGFGIDPREPTSAEIRTAAAHWLGGEHDGRLRVEHPVLLRMLLWKAARTGLPLQLHAGYGDADLELEQADPLLLVPWLKLLPPEASPIVLLHCYPFHREAGYLAQVFPRVFFDVGLAVNYTGAASTAVVAESLELAPFAKTLFSTDAWGLPELHHLGAALWRQAMTRVLTRFVDDGDWTLDDALRTGDMIGRDNAIRLYGLPDA